MWQAPYANNIVLRLIEPVQTYMYIDSGDGTESQWAVVITNSQITDSKNLSLSIQPNNFKSN